MFKVPNKFYTKVEGGGSSGTTSSNKKYEITITQPPEHKPSLDFIRGIPYAAKDNVMFCTARKFTLEEYKKIEPVIVFTKIDLDDNADKYKSIYENAGFKVVLCDNTCVLFCLERLVKDFKVRVLLYKGLCNLAVDNDCIELTLL